MSKSIKLITVLKFIKYYNIDTKLIKDDILYRDCCKIFKSNQMALNARERGTTCTGLECDACIFCMDRAWRRDAKGGRECIIITSRHNDKVCTDIEKEVTYLKNVEKGSDHWAQIIRNVIRYKLWKQIEEYRDIIVDEDL